jgi:tetratricopeptide (TPR) repeat protein
VASLVAVVAILLGAILLTNRPHTEPGVIRAADPSGPGGSATAGTTTPSTTPHDQVSPEEWQALLPRLEEEVSRDPEDDTARRRLALAFYNLGRLDEAQAVYEQLLARAEDAVVRNRLGNVLREKGDLVGAEAAYRRALTDDPALPAPYVNLAELLWRLRRTDEALDVLDTGASAVVPEARPALERAAAAIRPAGG